MEEIGDSIKRNMDFSIRNLCLGYPTRVIHVCN